MKQYYGGFFVDAEPMTLAEYSAAKGVSLEDNTPGYRCVQPSYKNQVSWVPADYFERFFKALE